MIFLTFPIPAFSSFFTFVELINLWGKPLNPDPNQGYLIGNIRFLDPAKGRPFGGSPLHDWQFDTRLQNYDNGESYYYRFKRPDGNFIFALPPGNYRFESLGLHGTGSLNLPKREEILKIRKNRVLYIGHIFFHLESNFKEIFGSIDVNIKTEIKDESEQVRKTLKAKGIPENYFFIQHFPKTKAKRII
ncbi:MAG: hypothetical protein HYZ83_05945 [Candidatus Omnitrophica bacterium]|nr:hypothetical protein [Candidatus Omnitrophota bacterium]